MRMRRLAAIGAAAVFMLGLTACGDDGGDDGGDVAENVTFAAGSTMDKLNKAGKIRIGTKFDQPGFGLKGLDGKPAGFDVEIGKLIAAELGLSADKIEWVEAQSRVREEYIEQDKVDLVVATYTINDTRKGRVGFAGPYYVAGQALMVRKDDSSITGPDSFKAGDKKVCSVTGSTPSKEIEKYLANKTNQLVLFGGYAECATALKNRQVDAVTTDNVILLGFVANDPTNFKLAGSTFTKEPYGIGVKKDDTTFRNWINDVLVKIAQDKRYEKAWKETAGKFDPAVPTAPPVDRY